MQSSRYGFYGDLKFMNDLQLKSSLEAKHTISFQNKQLWTQIDPESIPSTIEPTPELQCLALLSNRALEIGCGMGETTLLLAKFGIPEVYGVDINPSVIDIVTEELAGSKINFIVGDATEFRIETNHKFDLVVMQALLTCLPQKKDRIHAMKCAKDHLSKRGALYIADFLQSWHLDDYKERYTRYGEICGELGTFPVFNHDKQSVSYYAHHFTDCEIRASFDEVGLRIISFRHTSFWTRTGSKLNGFVAVVTNRNLE